MSDWGTILRGAMAEEGSRQQDSVEKIKGKVDDNVLDALTKEGIIAKASDTTAAPQKAAETTTTTTSFEEAETLQKIAQLTDIVKNLEKSVGERVKAQNELISLLQEHHIDKSSLSSATKGTPGVMLSNAGISAPQGGVEPKVDVKPGPISGPGR